jgi:serine/threonine protein kinase
MADPVYFQHFEVERLPDGGLRELGRGAMGITYKAFDTNLHCPVALKIINATLTDDASARERFLREARAAARLRHPNVATVLHLGRDGDSCFYAMEFIEGETLEAFIKRKGPLPVPLALEITSQIARALGAAQVEGLVHRDIKPANIMLARHRGEEEEEGVHVKVIDFGLAKFTEESKRNAGSMAGGLTMAGAFVGSPYFASPEQIDEGDIDIRSDIYSLGVTLWCLLTGEPPFVGSLGQIMAQHLQRPPPLEKLAGRGVPQSVCALLGRMLAKQREERPADPAALRRELAECQRALSASASSTSNPPPFSGGSGSASTRIAGRYAVLMDLGEEESGHLFKVRDELSDGPPLALIKLFPDVLGDAAQVAEVERIVALSQRAAVPGLVVLHALERRLEGAFLISQWIEGVSLAEVLRARGKLNAPEVLLLLHQAAATVDDASAAGLPELDLSLPALRLHFPGGLSPGQSWAGTPLKDWPPFELKISPLALKTDPAQTRASNERTLLPQRFRSEDRRPVAGAEGMVWTLAELVYELLGGTLPTPGVPRYPPLSDISENANAVLRRALLASGPGFANSRQFAEAFFAAASSVPPMPKTGGRTTVPPPLPPPLPPPMPFDSSVRGFGSSGALPVPPPMPPPPPILPPPVPIPPPYPVPSGNRWLLPTALAIGALLGLVILLAAIGGRRPSGKQTDDQDAWASPTPVKRALPVVPTPTPNDDWADNPTPAPTPLRATPTPRPASGPTPRPTLAPLSSFYPPTPVPRQPAPPAQLSYPVPPLAVYRSRLSEQDHLSSRGERLTAIPDILRQDRANFHRFNQRDPEDQADPFFADVKNRAYFDAMTFRGGSREAIINGDPLVEVAVYRGRVVVTVIAP